MTSPARPTLRRELGRWDLTAIGVNQVIGAGIFATPGTVAAYLGGWSWLAVFAVGFAAMFIALCFAEAGSRFEGTGGAYLYTREAFGRFVGFETGWMLFATRALSWASVGSVLALALGRYWPQVAGGTGRGLLLTALVAVITILNVRGIRQSALAVNVFTIAKLTPLVAFILLGLPQISVGALRPEDPVTLDQAAAAALMLLFAFGGFEVIPVPAGETRDPTKAVPFAMVMTLIIVTVVMALVQVVALGTLPNLATSLSSPLADAAAIFMGGWGAVMMTAGASVSVTGNNIGQALSGSRNLYALAEQGDLPALFGRIHPRFRTPDFSIVFMAALVLALALFSNFAALAIVSAVTRLVVYTGTCASVLVLRRRLGRAPFTTPWGPVVPIMGLLICGVLLYAAKPEQLRMGAYFMLAGAALYSSCPMEPPTMKRMTKILVLLAVCLAPAVAHAQKLVILVRHAERADGGTPPPGMTGPADPLLSAAGEARAQKLAAMLAESGVTTIYTTEFRRTQDTAKPLAAKLGVTAQTVPASDLAGLVGKIRSARPSDVVFIAGHSNTVPDVIRQLGGPGVTIADNEYDNLFILVPATGAMTRIRF